jgi:hypothetical protein
MTRSISRVQMRVATPVATQVEASSPLTLATSRTPTPGGSRDQGGEARQDPGQGCWRHSIGVCHEVD